LLFFPSSCISLSFILSPFSFSISPRSVLTLSLSFRYIHSTCAFFPLLPSFIQYLFSLYSFPHLNLAIIFLSFALSLSPPRNFLCHIPLIFPVVSFSSFFILCVFVLFTQLYVHSAFFCFQSFHFFTDIPVSLIVFLSLSLSLSLSFFSVFFFSPSFCYSILHSSIPSILSSNFGALFPAFTLSLFLLHSSLTMQPGLSLSTLTYFSRIFSTSSCSFHLQISAPFINKLSVMLSNIIILLLKSPSHFLSSILQTHPTTLFVFLTISLTRALSVAFSLNVEPKYLNSSYFSFWRPSFSSSPRFLTLVQLRAFQRTSYQ
jgi:hypothetical protein